MNVMEKERYTSKKLFVNFCFGETPNRKISQLKIRSCKKRYISGKSRH